MAEAYETDFYAWTQRQAEVLRKMKPSDDRLDRERVAAEIEDLGRAAPAVHPRELTRLRTAAIRPGGR